MNFDDRDHYFDTLRARWGKQTTLRSAASMTGINPVGSDEETLATIRAWGASALSDMLGQEVLRPTSTVYEIGCGMGRVASALCDYLEPGRYFGFDLSANYVQLCREHFPRGQFQVTPGYCFPPPDREVDLVIEYSVFCHMPLEQVWRWLLDAHRVLKPGGRTWFQFHNLKSRMLWDEFLGNAEAWNFVSDPGCPRSLTWDVIEHLMARAGLPVVKVLEADHDEQGQPYCWFVVGRKA